MCLASFRDSLCLVTAVQWQVFDSQSASSWEVWHQSWQAQKNAERAVLLEAERTIESLHARMSAGAEESKRHAELAAEAEAQWASVQANLEQRLVAVLEDLRAERERTRTITATTAILARERDAAAGALDSERAIALAWQTEARERQDQLHAANSTLEEERSNRLAVHRRHLLAEQSHTTARQELEAKCAVAERTCEVNALLLVRPCDLRVIAFVSSFQVHFIFGACSVAWRCV